jgi:PIN domain nuclease of toxin-antitoxin system
LSLLLDSNALLWWSADSRRLPSALVRRLRRESPLFVSVTTPWEIWMKVSAGKLRVPADFDERLAANRLTLLSPTIDDARRAARLPMHHRDPFDRMIIAQALNAGLAVVTGDAIFADYGVDVILV